MSVGQEGGVNGVLYSPDSTRDIYYGVMVENPSAMLAGDYTAQVVYTVTAELKKPSISSVSPNPIGTNTAQRVTLTGSNLDIVSKVTIDDRNTIRDCTNISASTNGQSLTCTLPALSNTGTYTITVETAGGQTAMVNLEVIPPVPSITSVSPNEVNVNNNTTVLTITGSNLATTSSVYIDFANIGTMDDGEECVIVPGSITDTQVKCTAPSRSVAFGPFPVGLITDGGDVSKSGAVSYVVQKPTITDNTVTPKMLIFAQTMGKSVSFTMKGKIWMQLPASDYTLIKCIAWELKTIRNAKSVGMTDPAYNVMLADGLFGLIHHPRLVMLCLSMLISCQIQVKYCRQLRIFVSS